MWESDYKRLLGRTNRLKDQRTRKNGGGSKLGWVSVTTRDVHVFHRLPRAVFMMHSAMRKT